MKTTHDDYPFGFLPLHEEEIEAKTRAYKRKERRILKKQLDELLAKIWAMIPPLRSLVISRITRKVRKNETK